MLHEITRKQLAGLTISQASPLVICDVDEVVVHFTRDFEEYLKPLGFWLDTDDLQRLNGSVKRLDTKAAIDDMQTFGLVTEFFARRTRDMQAIDGAVEGLLELSRHADVVMLTNLPHEAGDDRRHNLAALGLPFPVITNSGPKGHAIRQMVAEVKAPVVFIDDSAGFIASAYEHAPHVHLVHFLHDPRFHRNAAALDFVSLRTDHWRHVLPHAKALLTADARAIEPRAAAV
jgi:hypothetical protein